MIAARRLAQAKFSGSGSLTASAEVICTDWLEERILDPGVVDMLSAVRVLCNGTAHNPECLPPHVEFEAAEAFRELAGYLEAAPARNLLRRSRSRHSFGPCALMAFRR
jgi:hypothetical protein